MNKPRPRGYDRSRESGLRSARQEPRFADAYSTWKLCSSTGTGV
jgi:hypothetical protein